MNPQLCTVHRTVLPFDVTLSPLKVFHLKIPQHQPMAQRKSAHWLKNVCALTEQWTPHSCLTALYKTPVSNDMKITETLFECQTNNIQFSSVLLKTFLVFFRPSSSQIRSELVVAFRLILFVLQSTHHSKCF